MHCGFVGLECYRYTSQPSRQIWHLMIMILGDKGRQTNQENKNRLDERVINLSTVCGNKGAMKNIGTSKGATEKLLVGNKGAMKKKF